MVYGTLETIHDGLDANFEHGSHPIGPHLRLLREQFQQAEAELNQLATLPESMQQDPHIQLLQERLQQKADKMQIMYFAFNEAKVSAQLAEEIFSKTAFRNRDALLKKLTEQQENTAAENSWLKLQLAEKEEQALAVENSRLRLELAAAKEKRVYLENKVKKLTAELEQRHASVSRGTTCQSLDNNGAGLETENQGPNMQNQKRKRSDAGALALAGAEQLKLYA
jgi:hypothetical protein